MTEQVKDWCAYGGLHYTVLSDDRLFDPRDFGIETQWPNTACHRGFIAHYSVLHGQLFLTGLTINFRDIPRGGVGPELFGVRPQERGSIFGFDYEGLRLAIPFTGGLLLGGRPADECGHFASHPAWGYHEVRELILADGRVIEEHDRSASLVAIRDRFLEELRTRKELFHPSDTQRLNAEIEKCLAVKY